jgi:hypothetical protein
LNHGKHTCRHRFISAADLPVRGDAAPGEVLTDWTTALEMHAPLHAPLVPVGLLSGFLLPVRFRSALAALI